MSKLRLVPHEILRTKWDIFLPYFLAALKQSHDYARPEDIYSECMNGNAACYTAHASDGEISGVFVLKRMNEFGRKTLLVWIGTHKSKDGLLIRDYMDALVELAKHAQCVAVSTYSPRPFDRAIPGCERVTSLYEYPVKGVAAHE